MARKDQASQGLLAKEAGEVRLFKQIGWQLYNKGFQGGRKTSPQILLYQLMAFTEALLCEANVFRPLKRRYMPVPIECTQSEVWQAKPVFHSRWFKVVWF